MLLAAAMQAPTKKNPNGTPMLDAEGKLRDALQALSADALKTNNEAFLSLAETRLREALQDRSLGGPELKGDQDAPYSAIMEMMDALRKTKIETVALITEAPSSLAVSQGSKGGQ